MGGTIGTPPQPEDTLAPESSLTVEEFRAQFTEEMRQELCDGVNALRESRADEYQILDGLSKADAENKARKVIWPGMRALQLIGFLHPQPFGPIG